jgi:hypothetical protein
MHCKNSKCFEDTCQGECEDRVKKLADEAKKREIKARSNLTNTDVTLKSGS